MSSFSSFNLPQKLVDSLKNLKFVQPTRIQEATIPLALSGENILGSAKTGTGKTGAFGIPIIAKLLLNHTYAAIIITPTRELAVQVMQFLSNVLGKSSDIKISLLIGGEPIHRQILQLKRIPRLFIGTPGRINDHLKRKTLNLSNINTLVLDEVDRMLDMGFSQQVDNIVQNIPKSTCQTLFFSATIPNHITKLANSYMDNIKRVNLDSVASPQIVSNLQHKTVYVDEQKKYTKLSEELNNRDGSIIVFIKTKHNTDKISKKLCSEGHSAVAIHGDLQHRKREKVIRSFRNQKYRILVATDIAARGIDILHVKHVINYDLPQCAEDYLHRIGRTARCGSKGEAIALVSKQDRHKWDLIDRLVNHGSKDLIKKTKRPFLSKQNNASEHFTQNNKNRKVTRKIKRKTHSIKTTKSATSNTNRVA